MQVDLTVKWLECVLYRNVNALSSDSLQTVGHFLHVISIHFPPHFPSVLTKLPNKNIAIPSFLNFERLRICYSYLLIPSLHWKSFCLYRNSVLWCNFSRGFPKSGREKGRLIWWCPQPSSLPTLCLCRSPHMADKLSPCSLRRSERGREGGRGGESSNEESLVSLSTTTPRTSKLLGPVSIKTAARGDTPPLIHNKTQLLATAGGSPAKAVMRQTSLWINVTFNSPF